MARPYSKKTQKLALYAKALGHPARIAILEFLSQLDGCYAGSLAEKLPIAPSTLSQHLKALREAGLIKACTEPPRIKYCIEPANWQEARSLLRSFADTTGKGKK